MGCRSREIEPPDGAFQRDSAKHHLYLSNCGKWSLSVDLKTEEGLEAVDDLIERADVLLESYRPGVMEKLGLDYELATERNEELIYYSISGFGESDPYRDRPASDPIAQALSGVKHMTGEPDRKPSRVGAPLINLWTATNAVLSIMMAVQERERPDEGDTSKPRFSRLPTGGVGCGRSSTRSTRPPPLRMGDKIGSYAPVGA